MMQDGMYGVGHSVQKVSLAIELALAMSSFELNKGSNCIISRQDRPPNRPSHGEARRVSNNARACADKRHHVLVHV
jgi:hypothetical protein